MIIIISHYIKILGMFLAIDWVELEHIRHDSAQGESETRDVKRWLLDAGVVDYWLKICLKKKKKTWEEVSDYWWEDEMQFLSTIFCRFWGRRWLGHDFQVFNPLPSLAATSYDQLNLKRSLENYKSIFCNPILTSQILF